MTRPKTDIAGGFADALADIRQKVVEEPWFGRPVTDQAEPLDIWSTAKNEKEKSEAAAEANTEKQSAAEANPTVPPAEGPEPDIEPEL